MHPLLKSIKGKEAPVCRSYFGHHKSSDLSRMECQQHLDTIPATLLKLHQHGKVLPVNHI